MRKQTRFNFKLLCLACLVSIFLTGCGATKPPTPSGIRVPVTEFAQQRQKEAMQKKEEAKLNFRKDRATRNFSFGYEETEQ